MSEQLKYARPVEYTLKSPDFPRQGGHSDWKMFVVRFNTGFEWSPRENEVAEIVKGMREATERNIACAPPSEEFKQTNQLRLEATP